MSFWVIFYDSYDSMMSGSSILLKKCFRDVVDRILVQLEMSLLKRFFKRLGKKKLKPSTANNVSKAIGASLSSEPLLPYYTHIIPYHTIFSPHNITYGI